VGFNTGAGSSLGCGAFSRVSGDTDCKICDEDRRGEV